ncbi:MAG: penicillin-binding protein 2 [Deltaproteobacteria bacterium]|nr:penicillin-binding protein 2 [Deltaproteobacteria bacterium]
MISPLSLTRSQLRVRFLACVFLAGSVFAVLSLRLAWLQIIQGNRYRYLSENNRIRIERIPGPRGILFDREGEVLADVRAAFNAVAIPADIPRSWRSFVYSWLAANLSLAPEDVAKILEGPGPPPWKARIIKRDLSRAEMATVEAHRLELPGVYVQPSPVRNYPNGPMAGPALGYVGEISGDELAIPAYAEYEPGDFLGRNGIEWAWEGKIRGEAGGEQVEVNVQGRKLGVLAEQPPKPGRTLVLGIDRRLQKAAEDALGDRVGAVVALEIATGDVLTMVSKPSFDPNDFARGVSPKKWRELALDPLHPLQNRAIQGAYPPGSTYKIAMALAGLTEGRINAHTPAFCPGGMRFGARWFRCWRKEGHGRVELETALARSCDVYFYQLGINLGVDRIHDNVVHLGLGSPTGIDLPGERSGLIPSSKWKREVRKQPWFPGETLSIAIGQGYDLATPLQLAVMAATVGHPEGLRMLPRLVTRINDAEGRPLEEIPPKVVDKLPFRPEHLALVRQGLRQVVAGPGGTGGAAEVKDFPVAGKTGTAQVTGGDGSKAWEYQDHALFVCYAPAEAPKIAVSVLVEHGGHGGSAAAPVAKAVVEAYRDSLGAKPGGATLALVGEGP